MIYWVAATFKPKKKSKDEEEKAEELILHPEIVVATSEQTAAMKVTVSKASTFKDYDLDRVNIFVRPF